MKVIALVPMKGDSERVPKKNMRLFNGRPLCSVILEKLENSKLIDSIIVDTDCDKIKEFILANFRKVHVIDRPKVLRGHEISMNSIIKHDIGLFPADIYFQTHSTNPLLKEVTIERAIEKFIQGISIHDSLFSVTKFQTRFYKEDGTAVNHNPQELVKTQDLPIIYEENSCIYLFSKETFLKNDRRIGETPLMYEIPSLEAIDIDIEEEFILAEKLYQIS